MLDSGQIMKLINNLDESAAIIPNYMINKLFGNVHGSHKYGNVSMNKKE